VVPLEIKNNYISSLSKTDKIEVFRRLIFDESINLNKEGIDDELTEIICEMIESIQLNQRENFLKYYSKKSNSQPSKDSRAPFIYDDFFVFTVLVGLFKFNIEKKWIEKILEVRNENSRTITFKNLIDGNFINTNNEYDIIYCFLRLIQPTEITNNLANETFKQVNKNIDLFDKQDYFKILCSIKAYEDIILHKEIPSGSEIFLLRQFNEKFQKRIKITDWIIRSLIWFLLFTFLFLVFTELEFSGLFLEKFNFATRVIAIIGLSQFTNFTPMLKNISEKLTFRLYGYPGELKK